MVFWGLGYINQRRETYPLTFFTQDHGFSGNDIEKINALRVSEGVDISDEQGEVFISRLADTP